MPNMMLHTCKCGRKTMTPREIKKCEKCAEIVVLRVRGSYDAPGFDACVKAEMTADLG
jgi:hypothetical protein